MAVVALIVHETSADAESHAAQLGGWLRANGHEMRQVKSVFTNGAEGSGLGSESGLGSVSGLGSESGLGSVSGLGSESGLGSQGSVGQGSGGGGDDGANSAIKDPGGRGVALADVDLMVSLGGDGSMLRAVELAAPHKLPVLGINFGQLGYLTEVDPPHMLQAVEAVLDHSADIDERMRVEVTVKRPDGSEVAAGAGLNEALIERDVSGRTIRLAVSIDGEFFTTYTADGVIVATPTGSTAYSLSARGPIVAPLHEALVVTPVSPHQLFDRSLVLAPQSAVEIEILADRPASLSLDGRPAIQLAPGDRVCCTRSPIGARVVSFRDLGFLSVLKTKFGLADR